MWDEQIDEVARRLTVAMPPSDLRAQVLRRIAAGDESRRTGRAHTLMWTIASAVAALAVIAVAASLWRPGAPLRSRDSRVSSPPHDSVSLRGNAQQTNGTDAVPPRASLAGQAGPARRRPNPQSATPLPAEEPMPAFIRRLAIAPLTLDRLDLDAITPPDALGPEPVVVEPLQFPGEHPW